VNISSETDRLFMTVGHSMSNCHTISMKFCTIVGSYEYDKTAT